MMRKNEDFTEADGPVIDRQLMRADPGGAPFGIRHQAVDGFDVELEHLAVGRHGVLHTHHELHIGRAGNSAIAGHRGGLEDV